MPNENNQTEKELFSWTAPARPFKKRDREFYITVIAIASVVGLILFIAEGFMPVILLTSLIFLYYIMNTVEPGMITHKITTKGIKFGESLNEWGAMQGFWFSNRSGANLLTIRTIGLPGRLEMVINPEDKEKIAEILKKYITEEETTLTSMDKAANWIGSKLPNNQ